MIQPAKKSNGFGTYCMPLTQHKKQSFYNL